MTKNDKRVLDFTCLRNESNSILYLAFRIITFITDIADNMDIIDFLKTTVKVKPFTSQQITHTFLFFPSHFGHFAVRGTWMIVKHWLCLRQSPPFLLGWGIFIDCCITLFTSKLFSKQLTVCD